MLARLSWALFKRRRVGTDPLGNAYFQSLDKNLEGEIIERRSVKYRGDPDPTGLPPEWASWLSKTRHEPPAEGEIKRGQQRREAQAELAAHADAEAARRWQEGAMGGGGFTQQLGAEGNASKDKGD
jgi:NADH dehydrogenase [ubiquinone] 1 alpha subcomplex assembly factor 2